MGIEGYAKKAGIFRWPLFIALCMIPFLGGCSSAALTVGDLVDKLVIGLVLGSIYALIALGYTLVYGVIKLINFAHGDIYMLGAFVGYYMLRITVRWLHFEYNLSLILCYTISVIISMVLCALIAILMERLAYRPLRKSSRIAALITAVGVSFLLENAGIIVFGPNPKSYEPKTLPVYQVELSADESFSNPKRHEIMENSQHSFSASAFTNETFVRVRNVTKFGKSDWSPVLQMQAANAGEKNGFTEVEADEGDSPRRPHSLGFQRKQENKKDVVVLSWTQGHAQDIRLDPVFSNASGETYRIALPFRDKAGQELSIPLFSILIVIVTLITLWLLNILVNRSMFGISMRALSFDLNAAKLMGVDTDKVIAQTFAVGGAGAAIAGNMVGLYNQSIEPLMGILPGLKAFVAAVVGGIGSIPGAAVGGFIMGLSEALVKGYINPQWSALADALAFAILIVVLLFKPSGIFGSTVKEKV